MSEIKKFYLTTTTEGCATNLIENSSYSDFLKNNGYQRVENPQDAELIVVNTCGYTTDQEERSVKTIESLQIKYPGSKVLAGGCLSKIAPKKLKELNIDNPFSPGDVKTLASSLNLSYEESSDKQSVLSHSFTPEDFEKLTLQHRLLLFVRPFYFWLERMIGIKLQPLHNIISTAIVNEEFSGITVSQGCAGRCTFCSIKAAKGNVRSRPIEVITHEISTELEQGARKIWLLGDDIGCYGVDRDETFPMLLKKILDIPVKFQLVINYFEPYFFLKYYDEIEELLKDKRVVNLNLPLQSGNTEVVKEMGREYDVKEVVAKLRQLKKVCPHLVLKTNIIVGFPGETTKQFWDSVKVLPYFDLILALRFAARPRTLAAKMEKQNSSTKILMRFLVINTFIILRHAQVAITSLLPKFGVLR